MINLIVACATAAAAFVTLVASIFIIAKYTK